MDRSIQLLAVGLRAACSTVCPLRACAFYGPSLQEALQKGPRPRVSADHTVCTRACTRGSHNALVRMYMLRAQSRQANAGSTRESHQFTSGFYQFTTALGFLKWLPQPLINLPGMQTPHGGLLRCASECFDPVKMSWQDVVVDEVDLVTLARVHVCVSWATLWRVEGVHTCPAS